ncbi:MAG: AAA family ATPase [Gammaproteobacteria bacterium]
MRSIVVLNPKGGCGKSTLVTNLAGYYAERGKAVAIADLDPQGSSLDWLAARPPERPPIHGIAGWKEPVRPPRDTEVLVIDTPAGVHDARHLGELLKRAQSVLIPMLPSAIDMRAATRFVVELMELRRVVNQEVRLATVANRVRDHTLAAQDLAEFMATLKLPDGHRLPCLTVLRASQTYVHAAEKGLSIFEFARSATLPDREQWAPLLRWLNSARSQPG